MNRIEKPLPGDEDEIIDRFLQHQLSGPERDDFVIHMNADAGFKKRVDDMRLIITAIQETELQDKITQFHSRLPATGRYRTLKKMLAAAAVILVVGSAALWFIYSPSGNKQLFAKFYQPDPGLISRMGQSDNYIFEKAMIEYKSGDYETALMAWKELARSQQSDTLDYFIGSAYLALKRPIDAIPHLKKVRDASASTFSKEASWYLGLALLQTGQAKEAITYIEQSSRREKQDLLRKLR